MSNASIRTRLAIGMTLLVSLGLAVANVAGILLLRSYLYDRVDQQLGGFGPAVVQPTPTSADATTPATVPLDPHDPCDNPRDPKGLRSDFMSLVLAADGTVTCTLGPDLGDDAPDIDTSALPADGVLATVSSLDGDSRWRVRASVLPSGETMVAAVSLAEADATVLRLTQLSLAVSATVVLLTAAVAWQTARVGLRPLTRIEDTAEAIAAGDLTQRVAVANPRTEVGRLGTSLNEMLGQIEGAFQERAESEERLRRFVSDASHELRTPIASIRGHAELWRRGMTDDLETVMGRIESESTRMGDLVADLLQLARMDRARPIAQDPVDLTVIAADSALDAQAVQPERRVVLDAPSEPVVVSGDEPRLRQVVANLVANALAHTPTTADVTIGLRTGADAVELSVHDEGPGIPADVVAHIFDRFFRADSGRSRDQGGTGLGLAIVDSLTKAHGGTVTCQSAPGKGTTFTLRLPRSPRFEQVG